MTESGGSEARFSLRTAWAQYHQTPLRRFLRTETGSAAVLLAATLAALVWANVDASGYEAAAVRAARARTLIGSAPAAPALGRSHQERRSITAPPPS